ncbi:NAD(P)H-binding protein [Hamadaea tsunoensis]|uniref:NAD(P)H-binding protein n=1 Tax=Hamadaea tsunoensis TaxID=53368 RepID=UPI00041B066B|nr:NAD(P)H-binding protein [Hamadaea tsunoensis]
MKIAVTGSTGHVGGTVVRRLISAGGDHDIVGLTRQVAPYEDVDALRSALDGVDTLVFVSSDGEAAKVVLHHQNVLRAAVEAKVGHVVLLSGLDVDLGSPFCYAYTNGWSEQVLRASGLDFTIARAGLFAEFFGGLVRQSEQDGVVRLPAGRVSLVHRDDVAECLAVLALGEPTNTHHDLTGPEALDIATVVERAGFAYAEATEAQFAAALTLSGEEPWWVYAYSSMFAAIRQNRWQAVSGEVARLLNRPAVPFGGTR